MRNPLYLGNILLWLGFALSARLLWLAPIVVVLLAFEYHAIVRWEETLLADRLGEPYRRLHRRVCRGGFRSRQPVRPRRVEAAARVFSWRDTLYSERGTLIAIAAGYVLLGGEGMAG